MELKALHTFRALYNLKAAPVRFFHPGAEVLLEVTGQQVTLTFPEGVDVAHLFPEGSYKLLVTKGTITRAELREVTRTLSHESAEPLS